MKILIVAVALVCLLAAGAGEAGRRPGVSPGSGDVAAARHHDGR